MREGGGGGGGRYELIKELLEENGMQIFCSTIV